MVNKGHWDKNLFVNIVFRKNSMALDSTGISHKAQERLTNVRIKGFSPRVQCHDSV